MAEIPQDWFDRLDRATDYLALFTSEFGPPHHVTDDEAWAKCPVHADCDDPGKFSVNLKNGKWGCFKHDEHGSMIGLLKSLRPKTWRDGWIRACPNTKDIFGVEQRGDPSGKKPDSTRQAVDHFTIARDGAANTKDEDLAPLADKWKTDIRTLRGMGWFILRGGHEGGGHTKFCLPILNPQGGKTCGIRIRFLPPYPSKKDKDGVEHEVKSRVMADSKPGLLGLERLTVKDAEGKPLPVVVVEGEKDWAVTTYTLGDLAAVLSPSHGSGTNLTFARDVLRDRDVTFLYDEDEAGNKGSRNALTMLVGHARSLKWAHIGIPKKDVFNVVVDDGGGSEALLRVLSTAAVFTQEEALQDVAAVIRAAVPEDEPPEVVELCEHIFKTLSQAGALWLKTRNGEGYVVYAGRVYQTGGGDKGLALRMGEWTGIDSFGSFGSRMLRQLDAMAVERGTHCDTTAWYARKGDGIYLPLCDEKQQIMEILPSGMDVKPNGHGGVVVLPSENVAPIRFDPNFDEKVALLEWRKFFTMFTCPNEDRRLIEALLLMFPLYDWIDTHPIIRFSGSPGSGKSTAAKLMTIMLYGDERLFTATNAAMYRMGVNMPLIVLDNIEADGVDENLELFFLLAATGVEKVKSAMDSASRVIVEKVRSWVLTTGIDPITFGKKELSERSLIIPFGGNESDGFMPRAAASWVRERRNLFWNLILRKTWANVGLLAGGALERVSRTLSKDLRPRLREFYALASIVLGGTHEAHDDIAWLLGEHTEGEDASSVEDSPMVDLLCFMPAYLKASGQSLGIALTETGLGWSTDWIQTQRLSIALSSIARAVGRPYPFRSTQQMSTRLGLVKKQLDGQGFRIEKNENLLIEGKRLRAWKFFIPKHMGRAEGLFSQVVA